LGTDLPTRNVQEPQKQQIDGTEEYTSSSCAIFQLGYTLCKANSKIQDTVSSAVLWPTELVIATKRKNAGKRRTFNSAILMKLSL
jgi:hypothetical protein